MRKRKILALGMVWMYLYFWCQNLNIFLSKIWKHLIWNFEIIPIAAFWTFALIFFVTSCIHLLRADDIITNIAKIDVANRIHLFENWICWNKISLPWISQSRDSKEKSSVWTSAKISRLTFGVLLLPDWIFKKTPCVIS